MVAAFSVSRQPPANSSAARRKTAARSEYGRARHSGAAALAASTAAAASPFVALPSTPSTSRRLCGWTTSMAGPAPIDCRPPIVMVRSRRSPFIASRRACSEVRSALPGA
jgi:hypothetical protein